MGGPNKESEEIIMQFINCANKRMFNHLTAKKIAYLYVEGVEMTASSKEWKRINKRLHNMGLVTSNYSACSMDEVTLMAIDIVIAQVEENFTKEIDSFLEDMYIMGMLEEPAEEEDEGEGE